MRLKVFACNTLTRELGFLSTGCLNTLDIVYLGNLTRENHDMAAFLQNHINHTDSEGPGAYDAIVLAMGADSICGVSSQWFPIIVPRVHNSPSLLLGSAERFRDISEAADSDLYWYIPGLLERHMPNGLCGEELERYALAYGVDNARCLMGMERDWARFGGAAAYVQLPGLTYPNFQKRCEACAASLGWPLTVHEGDGSLLRALLDGSWGRQFLIVPPKGTFELNYGDDIVQLSSNT